MHKVCLRFNRMLAVPGGGESKRDVFQVSVIRFTLKLIKAVFINKALCFC